MIKNEMAIWKSKKTVRTAIAVLVVAALLGGFGYWFIYRPMMQRQHLMAQDFSLSQLETMTVDQAKASLKTKTGKSFDDWSRISVDRTTFLNDGEARYVGSALFMGGSTDKALKAYAVAKDMLGKKADIDFYMEYGRLALRARNTALAQSLKQEALSSIATSNSIDAKKRAMQRRVENAFSE